MIETSVKVGDRVSYDDMANPRRVGTVIAQVGNEWRVLWDDEAGTRSHTVSDLRQHGWNLVGIPSLVFDAAEAQELTRRLAALPWSGMVAPSLRDVHGKATAAQVLAWLVGFRDELVRAAAENEREREELRQLRADVAAVRRVFGTEATS